MIGSSPNDIPIVKQQKHGFLMMKLDRTLQPPVKREVKPGDVFGIEHATCKLDCLVVFSSSGLFPKDPITFLSDSHNPMMSVIF